MTTTLTLNNKPLPAVTTWHNFVEATVHAQLWVNPELVCDDLYHDGAKALAEKEGFDLVVHTRHEGLHGTTHTPKFARRSQEFWLGFAERLGLVVGS